MKEDYRQLSNILFIIAVFIGIIGLVVQYNYAEVISPAFFWLMSVGLIAVSITIKYIYSTHHHM
jgi:hypothetical protein